MLAGFPNGLFSTTHNRPLICYVRNRTNMQRNAVTHTFSWRQKRRVHPTKTTDTSTIRPPFVVTLLGIREHCAETTIYCTGSFVARALVLCSATMWIGEYLLMSKSMERTTRASDMILMKLWTTRALHGYLETDILGAVMMCSFSLFATVAVSRLMLDFGALVRCGVRYYTTGILPRRECIGNHTFLHHLWFSVWKCACATTNCIRGIYHILIAVAMSWRMVFPS